MFRRSAMSKRWLLAAALTMLASVALAQNLTNGVPFSVTDGLLQAGTAKIQGATWYQFSTTGATPVAANGTLNFNQRQSGTNGNGSPWAYYTVQINSSQAGTLYIFDTTIGGTPIVRGNVSVTGNTQVPATLRVPAIGQLLAQFQNSTGTAANVYFADMFSNN